MCMHLYYKMLESFRHDAAFLRYIFHVNIEAVQASTSDVIVIDDEHQHEEQRGEASDDQCGQPQEELDDDSDVDTDADDVNEETCDILVETNSDNIVVCKSLCCKLDRTRPNQPTATSILNAMKRVQGEGRFQQARIVQSNWFSLYPWLTLCETQNKLFCFHCFNAVQCKLFTFSKKAEATFSKTGGKEH